MNQDLVKELKVYNQLINPTDREPPKREESSRFAIPVPEGDFTPKSQKTEDYDLGTDLIDEGASKIVEIGKGMYALAPQSSVHIFQRD